jgi:glutamate 5-kinase
MLSDESLASVPSDDPRLDRKTLLGAVRTVVVKVGTNVLTRSSGDMALARIHSFVEELADLHREGRSVILVTSGAVSMGMHRLARKEKPELLVDKQALAAVGQIRLMTVYQQALANYGIAAAQILLTEDDFTNRTRYLNLRNTVHRLLEWRALPIINENDSISTTEIEETQPGATAGSSGVFGDNDGLSSLVASKLGADLLVILSDVEGLYASGPPRDGDTSTRPLGIVDEITPQIEAMASGGNSRGRGGMASKLRAIQRAVQGGSAAVIANGRRPEVIRSILRGDDIGTLFVPRQRLGSRKRWIAFANQASGTIVVNVGARTALVEKQKSLLFAGVVRLEGAFERGDVVRITAEDGREIARGISNYGSSEALALVGKHSSEVTKLVGQRPPEIVHRDNLAIWE